MKQYLWTSACAVAIACLLAPATALPQPRSSLPKLGILWPADPDTAAPYLGAFKEGLRDLGWIDGRTVQIVERYDNNDAAKRSNLAAELVAYRVDVLYLSCGLIPPARAASRSIPIVCADFFDPVAEGVTTSMAKPDGNVTGVSWQSSDLAGKRLQLTLELRPRARRIGYMFDANEPGTRLELQGLNAAARVAGVKVETFELRKSGDIEPSLAKLKDARLDALLLSANPLTWTVVDRIIQVAAASRLPVISEPQEFARAGAVITYGPDVFQAYRRGAYFVDRILRGALPADLPIEQPTRFDLVVNLKAARGLGLTVPAAVLSRATEVIQ